MDPIEHQSTVSGSMDHHKWEISKCDYADNNGSSSVLIFLCGYIISFTMDLIDHQRNAFGSMDQHRWEKSKCDQIYIYIYIYMMSIYIYIYIYI